MRIQYKDVDLDEELCMPCLHRLVSSRAPSAGVQWVAHEDTKKSGGRVQIIWQKAMSKVTCKSGWSENSAWRCKLVAMARKQRIDCCTGIGRESFSQGGRRLVCLGGALVATSLLHWAV